MTDYRTGVTDGLRKAWRAAQVEASEWETEASYEDEDPADEEAAERLRMFKARAQGASIVAAMIGRLAERDLTPEHLAAHGGDGYDAGLEEGLGAAEEIARWAAEGRVDHLEVEVAAGVDRAAVLQWAKEGAEQAAERIFKVRQARSKGQGADRVKVWEVRLVEAPQHSSDPYTN